jgi:hypothetical protein
MISKVKVIEVKDAPTLKSPAMLSGIRDKNAAQAWGEKNGHATVYFLAKRQRVYAERLQVRVDEQAKDIEQASAELVVMAESGVMVDAV